MFLRSQVKSLLIFKWLWCHSDEYGKLCNLINSQAISTGDLLCLILTEFDFNFVNTEDYAI